MDRAHGEIHARDFDDFDRLEPHVRRDTGINQMMFVSDDVRFENCGKALQNSVGEARADFCQRG
jgi:hypothetical protein